MFAQLRAAGGVESLELVWLTVDVTAAVSVAAPRDLVTATGLDQGEMVASLTTHHA